MSSLGFKEFILPHLRHHADGRIMGYGVREVPSDANIRTKLTSLFEQNYKNNSK